MRGCSRPEVEARCKRLSCVHPGICKLLETDHGPLIELMRAPGEVVGAKAEDLNAAAARRLAHKPVSRILGVREFYGRTFHISPDAFFQVNTAMAEVLVQQVLFSVEKMKKMRVESLRLAVVSRVKH